MDGAVVFQLPWHLKKCEVEQVYLWSWGDVNLPLCGIGKRVWFCRGGGRCNGNPPVSAVIYCTPFLISGYFQPRHMVLLTGR